ncbi:hypothetical protein [Schlesneria sp.]|uniref:hypothetical protein n=1 Tax=Schlesneria sp. TaxID=2762018 RepID=UPI002EDF3CF0
MAELLDRKGAPRERLTKCDSEVAIVSSATPNGDFLLTSRATSLKRYCLPLLDQKLIVTYPSPLPAWLPAVVAKLDELGNLPSNWNSYGADQIKRHCLFAAVQLMSAVMNDDTPVPFIVPTNRGTVLLEWHKRGVDLEIDVLGQDRYYVTAEDESNGLFWERDVSADLSAIVGMINRLS